MANKNFILGFATGALLLTGAYRIGQLHNIYSIRHNDYTKLVKHADGLQVSDYETLEDGSTLIYYELPQKSVPREVIMTAIRLDNGLYLLTDGQGALELIQEAEEFKNYKATYSDNWELLKIEKTEEGTQVPLSDKFLQEEKTYYQYKFFEDL